jgi:hypothetical protein
MFVKENSMRCVPMPFRAAVRLTALALAVGCFAAHAQPSGADPLALARSTYAEVNQNARQMTTQRFRARVPGVDYTSAVVAWLEQGRLRRLAVTDPDDSGDVLSDLYFTPDGELVFALRTTQGFKPNGAVEVRNENRLYFRQGRLVHLLAGLTRSPVPPADATAQTEAATTLAMAQSLRAAALAPPPPTVVVGQQRKVDQGRLLSLERGDAACYVELADSVGRVHREQADFLLCDQADRLTGQWVSLAYKTARVMAASCQGDPSCTRHDVVALVSSATPRPAAGSSSAPAVAAASWCKTGETNVFTCQAGAKRVSVCATEGASAKQGALYYRFGAAAGAALELSLPAQPQSPSQAATGEAVPFAGGGGAWLRFTQGQYAYVVYSGIGRWGRQGAIETRQGVSVERQGKPVATLACAKPSVDELGPDTFQRLGIAPDAQGFVFPDTDR